MLSYLFYDTDTLPSFPTYPMAHLLGVPVEIRFEMYRDILQCSGLGVVLVVDLPVYKPCEDVEDGDVLEPPQLTYQYIIPKGFHAILGTSSTIYREFALYAARRYPVDEKDLEKIGNVDKIVAHYIFHHDTEKHPILGPSVHGSGTKVLRRVMRKLKKPGPEQIVCLCEYVDENAVSYLNWWDVLHRTLDYGYYDYLDYDAQYHNQINTAWEYDTHCVMANATLKLVEKGKKQSAAAAARPEGKRRRDGSKFY